VITVSPIHLSTSRYRQQVENLLGQDLGFHNETSANGRHNMHAFPAKFPPQLPRLFIEALTLPGDVVLDPMMGSGTTIVETLAAGRHAIGFDIDPLAVRICGIKVSQLASGLAYEAGRRVAEQAAYLLNEQRAAVERELSTRFGPRTAEFIEYWFAPKTRLELMALLMAIETMPARQVRKFLELVFSAVIITKSGGVSLARDLAHTRPHRVADKVPRPAIDEFVKRLEKNAKSLLTERDSGGSALILFGNAENLPLASHSADLLVTSPPYASNAIDYMRAHKFSLVWLGHALTDLSALRNRYVGGEATTGFEFAPLPKRTADIVEQVSKADRKKGLALKRYYSEISRVLDEAWRVLKPGRAGIFVVGSSVMRGIDTRTQHCLGEIGQAVGFDLVGIALRQLDRDRRMMPARFGKQRSSQIEERMHEEYVIALLKPA